jgi:hypothetical protein
VSSRDCSAGSRFSWRRKNEKDSRRGDGG